MRVAYLDCFAGISGDMILGALVDTGVALPDICHQLEGLGLSGYSLEARRVTRAGLAATQVVVGIDHPEPHIGGADDLLRLIEGGRLSETVKEKAGQVIERLAEAEAHVHGRPRHQLHFHELGGLDTVIDVVGAVVGFELLAVEEIGFSPINVGGGEVVTAHGRLPVPAPGTARLLEGCGVYSGGRAQGELTTPTGAAILTTLGQGWGPMPLLEIDRIGYGAGSRELADLPNLLRLVVGSRVGVQQGLEGDRVVVMEANIDDMNPEFYDHVVEQLLAQGAVDVFITPILMKKNRPAHKLTLLCPGERVEQMVAVLMRETSTFGVRYYEVQRRKLERHQELVETSFGSVTVKVGRWQGEVVQLSPEYEDCKRLAQSKGVPLMQVYEEARGRARRLFGID